MLSCKCRAKIAVIKDAPPEHLTGNVRAVNKMMRAEGFSLWIGGKDIVDNAFGIDSVRGTRKEIRVNADFHTVLEHS